MGRRGPPKKPTELKLLQGNPGEHKLSVNEPKPKRVEGSKPPRWLGKRAKKIWRDRAKMLEQLGLLTTVDLDLFAMYCDAFEKMLTLHDFVRERGYFYPIFYEQTEEEIKKKDKPRLKYMAQFPQVSQYHRACEVVTRLAREFGMTPAARSGLNVKMPVDKDSVKKLLYG